jgi:hypothetical protein
MKTETLIQEIENCFPYVEKPQGLALPFHRDGCHQCEFLVEDLAPYKEQKVSEKGIREVYTEMSCLSAKGWRWVLPSYLRECVLFVEESRDFTEFLIYNLCPAEAHTQGAIERLSELNQAQLNCILSFLNWCQSSEHWGSKYCPEKVAEAVVFINKLKA